MEDLTIMYKPEKDRIVVPLPLCLTVFLLYGGIFLFSAVTHYYGPAASCMSALSFAFCDALFVKTIKSKFGVNEIVIKSSL